MDHMLDCYQVDDNFTLNNIEVKMGLKDMTLISGLKVAYSAFRPSVTRMSKSSETVLGY